MRLFKRFFVLFFAAVVFVGTFSCQKDDFNASFLPDENRVRDSVSRTILVYMAAKNNLWPYHDENINQMKEALSRSGLNDCNVIIYSSYTQGNPKLLQLVFKGGRVDTATVYRYPSQNAVDKEVMRSVLADVKRLFPARKNGLILWSHGLNWLPADVVYNDGYYMASTAPADTSGIELYSFGVEDGQTMELNDLRDALSDKGYQFILFDACLMGSAEVAYALRNKAEYLVASPAEIWVTGFPYAAVMGNLVAHPIQLKEVCEHFYDFYNGKTGMQRTGAISLIDLQQMEPLSDLVQQIYGQGADRMDTVRWRNVQRFDRGSNHTNFDLDDYVSRISSPELYGQFQSQLQRTVLYGRSTPGLFLGDSPAGFYVSKYCGLSVYIWQKAHVTLNETYVTLDWYKKVFQKE